MGVTIKDIAKLAHVSATTVSNVINGKNSKTTEETKQRILDLVKEMDYKPNAMARSLVNGKTKLLGLILPDISESYFAQLARSIEEAARRSGYSILVCSTYNDLKNEQKVIDIMREHCVDGIIISSSLIKENWQFKDVLKIKYPIVTLGRDIAEYEDVCNVCMNNYSSGYEATKYLLDLGHKDIGFIAGEEWSSITKDRLSGYKKALNDYKIDVDEELIYNGNFNVETGMNGLERLLSKDRKISGVVACSDVIAYGVYKFAIKHNISIPEDLSIVGIGDLKFSEVVTPGLTTVKEPVDDIAETAVNMLISIITKKPRDKNEYEYDSKLIVRESTCLCKERII